MSELKAISGNEIREDIDYNTMGIDPEDKEWRNYGKELCDTLYYCKSEADKVIAHHKYKRCVWTAMWCKSKSEIYNEFAADASEHMPSYEARFRSKAVLCQKWAMRWLELAKKFKEMK